MPQTANHVARIQLAAVVFLGGLSLSACATKDYVNEQIATVNHRVDAVDAKAGDAIQRADAANAAAQAAAADAHTANQRLDQLTPRVDTLEQTRMREQSHMRMPRN
jgi:outer membrane murein-binding lipoprotein Lpp